jgi:hypothetical protein
MSVKKHTCNICNKDYKTPQSLWNHKNKIHLYIPEISSNKTEVIPKISSNNTLNIPIVSPHTFKKTEQRVCNYCNKELSSYKNLHRHLQICKMKDTIIKENEDLIKANEELKKEMEDIKTTFEKFKKQMLDMMNKKCKMHPKTLQKMINNTNSHNNITINNNNIKYVALGNEELHTVFSVEEVMNILKKGGGALDEIIVYTHLNDKYPQFQNVIITNVRNKNAYIYCDKLDKYILCDKNEILNSLIDYRMTDLKGFYEEHGNNLNSKFRGYLERLFTFHYDKEYAQKKCIELNMTFYNQCNKENIKYKSIENGDNIDNGDNEIDC